MVIRSVRGVVWGGGGKRAEAGATLVASARVVRGVKRASERSRLHQSRFPSFHQPPTCSYLLRLVRITLISRPLSSMAPLGIPLLKLILESEISKMTQVNPLETDALLAANQSGPVRIGYMKSPCVSFLFCSCPHKQCTHQ